MEKIIDKINNKKHTLSFEVFPPKKLQGDYSDMIFKTVDLLKEYEPDFISVTYGTGGKNKSKAIDIANYIFKLGLSPLSHLTCYGYSYEDITKILDELYNNGVRNILALRGDVPGDLEIAEKPLFYKLAKELIKVISLDKRFCIGGAVYPEGHNDCKDIDLNIEYTKQKVDMGADFFITQLFFDNSNFYKFLEKLRQKNIKAPVLPGIFPVLKAQQIKRIIELTDTKVPDSLKKIIEKYEDSSEDMEKAGIEYAVNQINDLLNNGIKGIHLYTMNKAEQIIEIIKEIN